MRKCLELAQDADDLLYPWFQLDINGSPSFVYSMPLNWHILIRVPGAESNNTKIFLIILLGIRYIIANNIITKEWPTPQFVINFLVSPTCWIIIYILSCLPSMYLICE